MQPRLTRSNTDKMLAGVCGGLGEYFNIDPVIVRLIFVLVTLTSFIGLFLYPILWLLMPKSGMVAGGSHHEAFQQNVQHFGEEAARIGQQLGEEAARIGREAHEVLVAQQRQAAQIRQRQGVMERQPPSPSEYRFDPFTGQPITRDSPATGQTVNLESLPPEVQAQYIQSASPSQPPYPQPPRRAHNWSMLGIILIGIGGLILLEQIGVNMSLVFPALLIISGVILLRRRR